MLRSPQRLSGSLDQTLSCPFLILSFPSSKFCNKMFKVHSRTAPALPHASTMWSAWRQGGLSMDRIPTCKLQALLHEGIVRENFWKVSYCQLSGGSGFLVYTGAVRKILPGDGHLMWLTCQRIPLVMFQFSELPSLFFQLHGSQHHTASSAPACLSRTIPTAVLRTTMLRSWCWSCCPWVVPIGKCSPWPHGSGKGTTKPLTHGLCTLSF